MAKDAAKPAVPGPRASNGCWRLSASGSTGSVEPGVLRDAAGMWSTVSARGWARATRHAT